MGEYIQASSLTVNDNERLVALSLLSAFVKHSPNDFQGNLSQIMSGTLVLFVDANVNVRSAAWNAFKDIMASIADEDIAQHIDWLRTCVRQSIPTADNGFNIKQGLQPIMKM